MIVIATLQMSEARRQRHFARDALARVEALNEPLSTAERDPREAVAFREQAQPGYFSSSNGRASGRTMKHLISDVVGCAPPE